MTTNETRPTACEEFCEFIRSLSDDELDAQVTVGEMDDDVTEHIARCPVCGPRVEALLSREPSDLSEVAAFNLRLDSALHELGKQAEQAAERRTRLRLVEKAGEKLTMAAETTADQWPVCIEADTEDGERVQLSFEPAGFDLAVTLRADSPAPVVVTSTSPPREVVLTPGVARGLASLFDVRLTDESSPEELLRRLEAANLTVKRSTSGH